MFSLFKELKNFWICVRLFSEKLLGGQYSLSLNEIVDAQVQVSQFCYIIQATGYYYMQRSVWSLLSIDFVFNTPLCECYWIT